MKIVLATQNPGKLREIQTLARQTNDLAWIDFQLAPKEFNPEETGTTFAENALLKAKAAAHLTGQFALADDSGISVDALQGRPGVYSARYAEGNEQNGCFKLLNELRNISPEKRTAAYICVMILVSPDSLILCQGEGVWRGSIIDQLKGTGGFGYDPIFYLESHKKTVAEISLTEKNKLSHRAQAFNKIRHYLLENGKAL